MSQFPHADISEEGPEITAELSPYTRDEPNYWQHRPSDHSVEGLFVEATEGESCTLDALIGFTFCAVTAATPEGERRRHVVTRARRVTNGGRFSRPAKPANSGRKRKVA